MQVGGSLMNKQYCPLEVCKSPLAMIGMLLGVGKREVQGEKCAASGPVANPRNSQPGVGGLCIGGRRIVCVGMAVPAFGHEGNRLKKHPRGIQNQYAFGRFLQNLSLRAACLSPHRAGA